MCFELDSLPPVPAISGRCGLTRRPHAPRVRRRARSRRSRRTPDEPSGIGIVVLPDVRGLFRFYEELAMRFAEQGVNSVAIDYFGRTAGVSKRNDPDFNFMEHVMQTRPANVAADTAAAVAFLRSPAGGACTSVFTVGFCFGGSNSWNAGGRRSRPERHRLLWRSPVSPRRHPRPDRQRRHLRLSGHGPDGRRRPGHPRSRRHRLQGSPRRRRRQE